MFYRGMSTPKEQADVQTSNLWPAVVAALNEGKGQLQVGRITGLSQRVGVGMVDLVTNEGLRVCNFSVVPDSSPQYTFNTVSEHDSSTNGWNRLKTKRVKYMAGRIRKQDSDVNSELHSNIVSANKYFNTKLRETLQEMFNKYTDTRGWQEARYGSVSMEPTLSSLLLRLVKNDLSYNDVSIKDRTLIDSKFAELKKALDTLSTAYSYAEEFFSNDKWCLVSNANGGILAGAISKHPMLAAISRMRSEGKSIPPEDNAFSFAEKIVPFAWYKSISDFPDDMRTDIEMQLTMLKTHRNVDELLPKNSASGHTIDIWHELGACCKGSWSETKFILIDKQG